MHPRVVGNAGFRAGKLRGLLTSRSTRQECLVTCRQECRRYATMNNFGRHGSAPEGPETLARCQRVCERSAWSAREYGSRPERALDHGSPKIAFIHCTWSRIPPIVSELPSNARIHRPLRGEGDGVAGTGGGTRRLVCPRLISFAPPGPSHSCNRAIPLETASNPQPVGLALN